ncbi:TetR/AcrR family transcriptional regulator [Pseudokineococcus sp. 1T1Z-3]|uniref:TetR/AcrR family transcriptional regulator n=1 Tax=Pseudokineococcus sp. 1T1Z-3 TaxID=3132745 RepID=UPI0030A4CD15
MQERAGDGEPCGDAHPATDGAPETTGTETVGPEAVAGEAVGTQAEGAGHTGGPTAGSAPRGDRGPRARLGRADRRAQLLAAAQRVFARLGYHASGMDVIAERAGITKPVLYRHFPGKRELYVAVVDRACTELEAAVRTALAGTDDNRVRVAATIDAYFAFVDAGDGARVVFESDLTNDPAVRERLDRLDTACAAAITDVVAADTGLPRAAAHVLAVALAGSAQVSARSWLAAGRQVPREEAAGLIASLVWRGLRGFPRQPSA